MGRKGGRRHLHSNNRRPHGGQHHSSVSVSSNNNNHNNNNSGGGEITAEESPVGSAGSAAIAAATETETTKIPSSSTSSTTTTTTTTTTTPSKNICSSRNNGGGGVNTTAVKSSPSLAASSSPTCVMDAVVHKTTTTPTTIDTSYATARTALEDNESSSSSKKNVEEDASSGGRRRRHDKNDDDFRRREHLLCYPSSSPDADVADVTDGEERHDPKHEYEYDDGHQQMLQKKLQNYMVQSQHHFLKKQYRESLEYGNLFFEAAAATKATKSKTKNKNMNNNISSSSISKPTTTSSNMTTTVDSEEMSVVHLSPTILIPPPDPRHYHHHHHLRRRHPTTTPTTTTTKRREYSFAVSLLASSSSSSPSNSSSNSSSFFDQDLDFDQMASIVLQSWHELSKIEQREQIKAQRQFLVDNSVVVDNDNDEKKEVDNGNDNNHEVIMTPGSIAHQRRLDRERSWLFLMPMLDYYNNNNNNDNDNDNDNDDNGNASSTRTRNTTTTTTTISLDLFLVFIPFWESHQQSQHAFEWTVQVLRQYNYYYYYYYCGCFVPHTSHERKKHITTSPTRTSRMKQQKQLIELLWLHCICNQLPYIKADSYGGDNDNVSGMTTSPIEELILSITPPQHQDRNFADNTTTPTTMTISKSPTRHEQPTMLTMNSSMMTQVDPSSVQIIIDTLDVLLCSITSASASSSSSSSMDQQQTQTQKQQQKQQQQQQQQTKTTMMISKKTVERAHRWVTELIVTKPNKDIKICATASKTVQETTNVSSSSKETEGTNTKRRKSVTFASSTCTDTSTEQPRPVSDDVIGQDTNHDDAGGTIRHRLSVVSRRRRRQLQEQFEVHCRNVVDWIRRLFVQVVLKVKMITRTSLGPSPTLLSSFTSSSSSSDMLQQGLSLVLGVGVSSIQRDHASSSGGTTTSGGRSISTTTALISTSFQSFVRMIKENQQLRQRVAFIVLMVLLSINKSNRRRARQVATNAAKSVATTVLLAPIREVMDALGLSATTTTS